MVLGSDDTSMVVEIVMTQDEWDDLLSIRWGGVEPAAQHVRELVLGRPRGRRYLVYSQYNLMPSDDDKPHHPDPCAVGGTGRPAAGRDKGAGWYAYKPD